MIPLSCVTTDKFRYLQKQLVYKQEKALRTQMYSIIIWNR